MRIIGGKFKGHHFNPPDNIPTRPTTDIAKEALFNTLNNYFDFESAKFLDLFGGTGSISYEMSSRGCCDITCVEIFPRCVQFIGETVKKLGLANFKLHKQDVFQFLENDNGTYDIIFAGPPYPLKTIPQLPEKIFEKNLLRGAGWFVLEHNPDHQFDMHRHFILKKKYGTTIFSIFSKEKI